MTPPPKAKTVAEYRKCGRRRCKCHDLPPGQGHGPYLYAKWREGRKVHSAYIGKPPEEPVAP